MKKNKIFNKQQQILFVIIAGCGLIFFYFTAQNYCVAGLQCASAYCEKTRNQAEKTCVTRGLIIFSVPIVLAANVVSAGVFFVSAKIQERSSKKRSKR